MPELLKKKILSGRLNFEDRSQFNDYVPKGLPRSCELLLAAGGLILLFPVFLLCAALVRLSSKGAVFFRQKRIGRGGEAFTLYKFRTMVESREGLLITADGDRRITRIGRVLRKTKLDELPEIYNVLRGDMALVGPRPEVPDFVDLRNPLWKKVLRARPGITDPVTLRLRNEEAFLAQIEDKESFYRQIVQPYKLAESLKYLETRSFYKDLKIIAQTFLVIVFPQTAVAPTFDEARLSFIE